jgi:hypothetical protein
MLKFTYKGRFLTIKIAYKKFLDFQSKWWKHALLPLLHVKILIFEKNLNLKFWWYFKVSALGRFGQIWAEFAALALATYQTQSTHQTRLDSIGKTPQLMCKFCNQGTTFVFTHRKL